MHTVTLPAPADFEAWRGEARRLAMEGVAPHQVQWRVTGEDGANDLFAGNSGAAVQGQGGPRAPECVQSPLRVPRAFIEEAQNAICHSAPSRFDLLYRLLWRLRSEPGLMQVAADRDVHQLMQLAKAVRRDKHKMTAFLRFRETATEHGPHYLAWFEPEHHIVEAVAPFFVKRFAGMRWSILTPKGSLHWDGEQVAFGPGARREDVPGTDALERHWRTYFSSIFNPARLNTRAMKREMPVRYWKNMPEAALIPALVRSAGNRTDAMLAASAETCASRAGDGAPAGAGQPAVRPASLDELAAALETCRRCPIGECASRAVPGEGPAQADIVFVGEQPGDVEDQRGRPFVGPAGHVLDQGLAAAGLPRQSVFLTNAVKHFKFLPRGKIRQHQTPNRHEVAQCRPWLLTELDLIRPRLVVALGATAASSLLGRPVKIGEARGRWLDYGGGAQLFITVHPSYLLRLRDHTAAEIERQRFFADLAAVRHRAEQLAIPLLPTGAGIEGLPTVREAAVAG